ncbi:MAG TPA: hypothetical protein VKA48_08205 [Gammaproteobacteria bacterium]|nr:hypothetical protein [Gammaproteobacteria bacterium]
MATRLSLIAALPLCALLAVPTAFAGANAGKEISTAIEHANFATQMKQEKKVKMHLHHVVNCLAGPKGRGFNSDFENPCKGMGNGALKDAKGNSKAEKDLKQAFDKAQSGITAHNYKSAHQAAAKVEKKLKSAKNAYH